LLRNFQNISGDYFFLPHPVYITYICIYICMGAQTTLY